MDRNDHHAIMAQATAQSWRIEHVIHLGSMLNVSGISASLERLLAGWQVSEVIPALGLPFEASNWPVTDIADFLRLNSRLGFLVQLATPIKHYASQCAFTSTWRTYRTEWVYADDFQQVPFLAAAWVQCMDEIFRADSLGNETPRPMRQVAPFSPAKCIR